MRKVYWIQDIHRIPGSKIIDVDGKRFYVFDGEDMWFWVEKYKGWAYCPGGYVSDGATGASDIHSLSWPIHDSLCGNPIDLGPRGSGPYLYREKDKNSEKFRISAWQVSYVLRIILKKEKHPWYKRFSWRYFTLFLGCKIARKGM